MKSFVFYSLIFASMRVWTAVPVKVPDENREKQSQAPKTAQKDTGNTTYAINEAKLFIELPNSHWHRTRTPDNNPIQYIFKRDIIIDSAGRQIIPAITLFYEDAKNYDNDLSKYYNHTLSNFLNAGVIINQTFKPQDDGYPIPFKNGVFFKTSYTAQGVGHILYLFYFINKNNIACMIGMDMTKNIAAQYEQEFWITIRSLKDL